MESPVELFLALRYLRPRRSFVSIITVLSFLGVMIGVATLIVVLSVMAGFQQVLMEKIVGFNAHVTVAMTDGGVLYDSDKTIAKIKQLPEVVAVGPIIKGPVLVRHQGRISSVYIKSVPQEGDDPVLPLSKFVKKGEYELRGDSVIVGSEWGRLNSAFPGDVVEIFGPAQLENALRQESKNRVISLPESPIIRGIFQTDRLDYDANIFLISTEMAQRLYGLGDGVHGIAVRVRDPQQADEVKDRLNKMLSPEFHAHTWMDENRELFSQIIVERVVMACILCLILMVAAFGLCSTLITVTIQKSREIGLMKALGANDFQVCAVFLIHGFVIGIVGSVSGTILGLLILHNLHLVRDFLLFAFHIQVFPSSVYGLPEIPSIINPLQITIIATFGIVICILAALIPAINASRLAPARALRYE